MYNTDFIITGLILFDLIFVLNIIYTNRKNNINMKLSKDYLKIGEKIADNLYEVNKAVRTLKNSLMQYNSTMVKLNDSIENIEKDIKMFTSIWQDIYKDI